MSGHSVFLVKPNCCVYFWRIGGNYGEVDQTLFATAYNHDRAVVACSAAQQLLSSFGSNELNLANLARFWYVCNGVKRLLGRVRSRDASSGRYPILFRLPWYCLTLLSEQRGFEPRTIFKRNWIFGNSSAKSLKTRFQLMVPVPNRDVTKNLTGLRMYVDGPQISYPYKLQQ